MLLVADFETKLAAHTRFGGTALRKIIIAIFLATGLVGGAAVAATAAPAPQTGQIVMSISCPKEWVNLNYTVFLRRIGDKKLKAVTYDATHFMRPIAKDFAGGEKYAEFIGAVLVETVPAGDYEIVEVGGVAAVNDWVTRPDFSLPIKVEAGRAVYVGEFRAQIPHLTSLFAGLAVKDWPYLVSDQSERDLPFARAKGLADPVDVRVVDARLAHHPYLIAQ